MKKLTLAIIMLLSTFSMASAELGINVGVSGQIGVFEATGHEREGSTTPANREVSQAKDAMAAWGYSSVFIEKTLGRFALGFDYVPEGLESDTKEHTREFIQANPQGAADRTGGGGNATITQKIQVEFTDMMSGYISAMITENLYVQYGVTSVDVKTKEALGTLSTYGDTNLDGTFVGVGYHKSLDNGLFFRASGQVMNFDAVKMTSSTSENEIRIDELNGASGKVSIGKSF